MNNYTSKYWYRPWLITLLNTDTGLSHTHTHTHTHTEIHTHTHTHTHTHRNTHMQIPVIQSTKNPLQQDHPSCTVTITMKLYYYFKTLITFWCLRTETESAHLADTSSILFVTVFVKAFVIITAARTAHRISPPGSRAFQGGHVLAVTTTLSTATLTSVGALPLWGVPTLGPVLAGVVAAADILTAGTNRAWKQQKTNN